MPGFKHYVNTKNIYSAEYNPFTNPILEVQRGVTLYITTTVTI